jgi:hypothetical protein
MAVAILLSTITLSGCEKSQVKRAAQASGRAARAASIAVDIEQTLTIGGVISQEESQRLAPALVCLKRTTSSLSDTIRSYADHNEITPSARSEVFDKLSAVSAILSVLSVEALPLVKSTEARRKLASLLAAVNVSVAVISEALDSF